MSHLLQITRTGVITTLPYDGTAPSLPQLRDALSSDDITVETLAAPAHSRGEHLTIWADNYASDNGGRINVTASAYAVAPLIGTVIVSGFNTETGDTVGLTDDQAAEERYALTTVAGLISTHFPPRASIIHS